MEKQENAINNLEFSIKPIIKQNILFSILMILILLIASMFVCFHRIDTVAKTAEDNISGQISTRLEQTVLLLKSLAVQDEFIDDSEYQIKINKLSKIREIYNFYDMAYVDANMTGYMSNGVVINLSSRDYLQRLFATGDYQVTDSFSLALDNSELNYVISVPIIDNNKVIGALTAAIHYNEIENMIKTYSKNNDVGMVLVGSNRQVMTSTLNNEYGSNVIDIFNNYLIIGTSSNQIEEDIISKTSNQFYGLRNGILSCTTYTHIEDTNWSLVASVGFFSIFVDLIPFLSFMTVLVIVIGIIRIIMRKKDFEVKNKQIHILTEFVEELQNKIYTDNDQEKLNFDEILKLTSNGLTDGLTGAVTRNVFLNNAVGELKKIDNSKESCLIFIDLDNLKYLNDSYGHSGGDMALKSIGYVLREYEKRYEGLVGRYGGDEFVMLLTNVDDINELHNILDELILRLSTDVFLAKERIMIQCSLGVSIYQEGKTIEDLIVEADEALYFVKQNGKGYYKIYEDGNDIE